MGQVFISYSTSDSVVAGQIAQALRDSGVKVWMAPGSIEPGQAYNEAIVAGLRESDTLAVLVSSSANSSKHVAREVGLADGQGKRIIPIRIEAIEPSDGLAYYLSLPQWVEWHTQGAAALQPLLALLKAESRNVAAEPRPADHAIALSAAGPSTHVASHPAQGVACIRIVRGDALAYRARKYAILVDGQKVAEVGNASSVDVSVQAGEHAVAARVDFIRSDPLSVAVVPGETAVVELATPELKDVGAQLSSIIGSSGYLRLTRIS